MLEKFLNIFRIPDLRKRVLFTLGVLAVYRLGAYIPTPGVDGSKLEALFNSQGGSSLDLMNLFGGGNLRRMTIFALGIMPYITASIIFQLLTVVYEPLARIQKEGELGRRKITQWTRYMTVILGVLQSIGIAAMQLALERGVSEAEQLRQVALRTNTAGDAAIAMDYRNTLGNFRGRISDLREAMISAATLIPLIASNRKAAETRVSKLTTGIMVTIPRLMAVAAQAVVQADTRRAGEESEKLDEAARRITELAVQGAHDAAVDAAHSLGGDPRNLESLAAAATQSIETMKEVLAIEQQVLAQDREREQKLIEVRNKLVEGMRGVQAQALAAPPGA